jgi:acetyltransferase-like isoleucine patch superfamily enzyme
MTHSAAFVAIAGRIAFTVCAIIVVELVACGVAAAPIAWYWLWLSNATAPLPSLVRAAIFGASFVPCYGVFALLLLGTSAATARVTGAHTPPRAEMRIGDFAWPLLTWVRYMASIHVARLVAGPLLRASPIWTAYLRANGARMGRRVYVNTLSISDHNLLDFGDDVVIGADVHVSGHTVEAGVVKTGPVRLGRGVTIGLSSVVEIDVAIGDRAQVGALSFVPKHTVLEPGGVYAGIPVALLKRHPDHGPDRRSPFSGALK